MKTVYYPRRPKETPGERQERKIAEARERGDQLPVLSGLWNDLMGR
jgi:hypothetical protein